MIPNGGKAGHWGVPQWTQAARAASLSVSCCVSALVAQRPVLVGGGNPEQREPTLLEGGAGQELRLLQLRR